ncbi:MAG: hypothetical protein FWD31_15045 [Planctomycetaceae bacterium]|nr:hypothetical protein [Planctomycetaceae bacterium]
MMKVEFQSKKKKFSDHLIAITILAIIPIGMVLYGIHNDRNTRRTTNTHKTIKEFLDAQIKYQKIYRFAVGADSYIGWYAGRAKWDYLASGSAVYVFDSNGNLIDYTCDIGEDTRFAAQWPVLHSPYHHHPIEISLEELRLSVPAQPISSDPKPPDSEPDFGEKSETNP